MYIDSHAHIQINQFQHDQEEVIKRANQAEVNTILVVGFDLDTSISAIALSEKHDNLLATVGLHPHNAKDLTPDTLKTFHQLIKHEKVIAFGEIGLDYYRNLSPKNVQIDAFEKQLNLAEDNNLPIIIHNRDAYVDILPILEARRGKVRGVLHCFTGNVELMHRSLQCGFHIGIGGIVTFPNAKDMQTVAKAVPQDKLLIETDCPWLTPQFQRGKRNEPAYVVAVAEKIAELRKTTTEAIAEITTKNFNALFGISKSNNNY